MNVYVCRSTYAGVTLALSPSPLLGVLGCVPIARAGGRDEAPQHCRRRVTVAELGSDVPSMSDGLACVLLPWLVSRLSWCLALSCSGTLVPAAFAGDVSTLCSFPAWLLSALDRHTSGSDTERGWGGEERYPRVGKDSPFLRLNHLVFCLIVGTTVRRPPARPPDHSFPHGGLPSPREIVHLHFPPIGCESGLGEIRKHRFGTTHTVVYNTQSRRLTALPLRHHGLRGQPVRWRNLGSDCVSSQRQTGSRRRLFPPFPFLWAFLDSVWPPGTRWLKILIPPVLSLLLVLPAHCTLAFRS